jgi:hypothetical protein
MEQFRDWGAGREGTHPRDCHIAAEISSSGVWKRLLLFLNVALCILERVNMGKRRQL